MPPFLLSRLSKSACQLRCLAFFQFRLRTILIMTAIIAGLLSYWSVESHRQRKSVHALQDRGASIDFNDALPGTNWMVNPPKWPRWILNIDRNYFATVEGVNLRSSQIVDADLKYLEALTDTRTLDLGNTQITDVGLRSLRCLVRLRRLDLENTKVTDIGIQELDGLRDLRWLQLGQTQITDVGVARLRGIQSLEQVGLSDTLVTDTGIVQLNTLTDLKVLDVHATKVSVQGLAKLKHSLPKCLVHH